MTFAPQTLRDLAAFWASKGGVNLGIVGDASHANGGTSYHLGESDLADGAYSAKLPRDVEGLSEAASAIDLGKLGGTLANLQAFSNWLVSWCRTGGAGAHDVREIIWSPDGFAVRRYDATSGAIYAGGDGTGQGDNSHRTHTHVSYWRDSEFRDKRDPFRAYFDLPDTGTEHPPGDDVAGLLLTDGKVIGRAQIQKGAPYYPLDGSPGGTIPAAADGSNPYKDVVAEGYSPALNARGIVVGDEFAFIPSGWYSSVPVPPTNPDTNAAYNAGRQAVLDAGAAVPER